MPNTKVVFSKELANILCSKGFKLLKCEINLKDPHFKVFIFECNDELEAIVEEYKKSKRG